MKALAGLRFASPQPLLWRSAKQSAEMDNAQARR
jgi:hypothetical protein